MFLLLRTEDIASNVFICPSAGLTKLEYGGTNTPFSWTNWPGKAALAAHLSYSYQNPYPSKDAVAKGFKFNNALSAEFVTAGDMNPGVDALTKVNANSAAADLRKVNSANHGGDGQNILFADGHVEYDQNPFVGVKRDNVYTYGPSGDDAKDKGGDGIVGAPVGPGDSILLPAAKNLGVVDNDGALTAETKKSREAALEADRPVTPAEQDATRLKVIGNFVRGNSTMKISEGKIEIGGDKVATFDFKFAGLDRTKAMLNLIAADDPASISEKVMIELTQNGMTVSGPGGVEWSVDSAMTSFPLFNIARRVASRLEVTHLSRILARRLSRFLCTCRAFRASTCTAV